MMNSEPGLAILGGTFDPVHFGHLQSAIAVKELLAVPVVKLVPSFIPPHRGLPNSTAIERLSMLQIASHDNSGVVVDDREISRQGVSYTVDTLTSFRQEIGENASLYFILGIDSYCTLNKWVRWQELTGIAHLIVLARPGYLPQIPSEVRIWQSKKLVKDVNCMRRKPGGEICHVELVQIDVSATEIREMIGSGVRPAGKMPESVIDFAFAHELYRS
jgi:nicotinate-nucleotide adenylyltransferase